MSTMQTLIEQYLDGPKQLRQAVAGMSREAREHGRGGTHTLEEDGEEKHQADRQCREVA